MTIVILCYLSEAMRGSLPLVKVGLQMTDPLYSILDVSKSPIKDISKVTGSKLSLLHFSGAVVLNIVFNVEAEMLI